MLFPNLGPSSIPVVVDWWSCLTKDMQIEQLLCWSCMTGIDSQSIKYNIKFKQRRTLCI